MRKLYYLFTLTFVFGIPALVASYYLRSEVSFGELLPFICLVTLIGSIWDIWATRHGIKDRVWLWEFNRSQTLGLRLFGLPLEEYLFYVVSSVYVVYMWEAIKYLASTNSVTMYVVIAALACWTLIAILVPYFVGPKGDKLIN